MNSLSVDPIGTEIRLALQSYQTGDLAGADKRVDALYRNHSNRPDVLMAKGMITVAKGDSLGALSLIERSLELDPRNPEALGWATNINLGMKRFGEALIHAQAWSEADPGNPRSHYILSTILRSLNRTEDALKAVDRTLELDPNDSNALVLKARLLRDWRLTGLAIDFYKKAAALGPNPHAAIDLAQIYLRQNEPELALEVLEPVLPNLKPEDRPYDLVAHSLTAQQRFEEADENWSKAEIHTLDAGSLRYRRAMAEISVGRFEVARAYVLESIDRKLALGANMYLLGLTGKFDQAQLPMIESMEAYGKGSSLGRREAIQLEFGLGKAYDDLGDFESAARHFDRANQLRQEGSRWSRESMSQYTDLLIEVFSRETIQSEARQGLTSDLPLFILGMVRSGTTLAETIFGAHSKVKVGGERPFWRDRSLELVDFGLRSVNFDLARQFAPEYLDALNPRLEPILRSTDKNPGNTFFAPLLHALYPEARMIYMKRAPIDNLLSIWFTNLGEDSELPSTKSDLIALCRDHRRLLEHLQEVLPQDRFLTVSYEDMTGEPAATIPGMLDFVGLEFEDACLQPHLARQRILTPSVAQVSQPISTRSQGRWRNYIPYLGEFSELLDSN